MGCHFLLQRIFLIQGSDLCLLLEGGFFTTEPPGKPPLFTVGNHLSLLTLLCYSQRIIKFCLSRTSYVTRKLSTYFTLASGLYLRSEHMRNVYLVTGKYTGFFWCISEFVCMKLCFNYWVYAKNSKYVINTMITMQNCWTAHCCYCPIFKAQSFPAQPSRTTSWSVNQKSVNISYFLKLKSKYPIKWIFC